MTPDETARPYGAADLLDTPPEEAFDRITKLVARLLHVPVALVTILDQHRQFFKSELGLGTPWSGLRETPLSHSFCKHVVATESPLVVGAAREHPLVRDNLAITDLGVEAYLGVPIRAPDGAVIGSLCAIDSVPRHWGDEDEGIMSDLVAILEAELGLREEVRRRREAEAARQLLMREMEHRVKNSFAKVQAIVTLSMRQGGDIEHIRQSIIQRIASLARTQSLLAASSGQATLLSEIMLSELGHYDEAGRLTLNGAPVRIAAEEAVAVGMIAHELCTNAAKYGAIAQGGAIEIDWQEMATPDGRRLRLAWSENGVALPGVPSTKGFGSTLLDVLVVRQHNGTITRDWLPTGLRLVAEFDLATPG